MPLTQDCLTLLVDLTTGHYNRGTQTTSLWLTFLTSVQRSRTLEHTFLVFNSRSMVCIATPTGNMPEASEIQIPPIFQTCSMVVLMVSTVEGFQFIYQTYIDTADLWTLASARVLQWFMFNGWLPPLTLGQGDCAYYCQPFQSLHAG